MLKTLILCFLTVVLPAMAQRPTEVKGTLGYATFIDESDQSHAVVGGSVRQYITNRLSIEPELFFLYKDRTDKDILFQPNVSYDFGRRGSKFQPYVIGGVGVLHTIQPRFSVTDWTFSGGAGVKIWMSERWYFAPEGRIGFEPILRLQVSFGYRF